MKRLILAMTVLAFAGCGGDKDKEEKVEVQEGDEGDVGPDDPQPLPPDEIPPIDESFAEYYWGPRLLKAGMVLHGKPYLFGGGRNCNGASCKNSDCSGMIYQAHLAHNLLDLKKIRASARSQWDYFLSIQSNNQTKRLDWNPDTFTPGVQLFWRSGTRTPVGKPSHTGYYYGKDKNGRHLVFDCAPNTGCAVRPLSGWLANKSYIIGAVRVLRR
jgi:hypothetical protein